MTAGVRQPGVRPAQLLGHPVVQRGHALDVHLVDHGVAPAAPHRLVAPQSKSSWTTTPRGDVRRGVGVVALVRRVAAWSCRRSPGRAVTRAGDRAGVGVQQQLGRVEPQALLGLPGPVDTEAVAGAGRDVRAARRARSPATAR